MCHLHVSYISTKAVAMRGTAEIGGLVPKDSHIPQPFSNIPKIIKGLGFRV